jgi:hypothetical protein
MIHIAGTIPIHRNRAIVLRKDDGSDSERNEKYSPARNEINPKIKENNMPKNISFIWWPSTRIHPYKT